MKDFEEGKCINTQTWKHCLHNVMYVVYAVLTHQSVVWVRDSALEVWTGGGCIPHISLMHEQ